MINKLLQYHKKNYKIYTYDSSKFKKNFIIMKARTIS